MASALLKSNPLHKAFRKELKNFEELYPDKDPDIVVDIMFMYRDKIGLRLDSRHTYMILALMSGFGLLPRCTPLPVKQGICAVKNADGTYAKGSMFSVKIGTEHDINPWLDLLKKCDLSQAEDKVSSDIMYDPVRNILQNLGDTSGEIRIEFK